MERGEPEHILHRDAAEYFADQRRKHEAAVTKYEADKAWRLGTLRLCAGGLLMLLLLAALASELILFLKLGRFIGVSLADFLRLTDEGAPPLPSLESSWVGFNVIVNGAIRSVPLFCYVLLTILAVPFMRDWAVLLGTILAAGYGGAMLGTVWLSLSPFRVFH